MRKSSDEHARRDLLIEQEYDRLHALLEEDPHLAISEARNLVPTAELSELNLKLLRSAIFIDGGAQISDRVTVSEGIGILRHSDIPDMPGIAYNLANGIAALAKLQEDSSPGRIATAPLRLEARDLFYRASELSDDLPLKSRAATNRANLLKDSFRWVEAYDAYAAALQHDPRNAIALTGISNLLRWRLKRRVEHGGALRRAAIRYLLRARDCRDEAHLYAGPMGVKRIDELLEQFRVGSDVLPEDESPPLTPYAAYVRRHRLALCLTPESAGSNLDRWDHLAITSVIGPVTEKYRVPTIFATWNLLKADFLAARWLAYSAVEDQIAETGSYADTLDYATYGTAQSMLVLAQRAAVDVLDKISVAATDYLGLPGDPQRCTFGNRWHVMEKKGSANFASPLRWQTEIEAEIAAENPSLIALGELAYDYVMGYVRRKRDMRNSATHRFVVLHDISIGNTDRESSVISRFTQSDFERLVVDSLQLARAALLYFREMIAARERRLARHNQREVGQMVVPSHQSVRGEKK